MTTSSMSTDNSYDECEFHPYDGAHRKSLSLFLVSQSTQYLSEPYGEGVSNWILYSGSHLKDVSKNRSTTPYSGNMREQAVTARLIPPSLTPYYPHPLHHHQCRLATTLRVRTTVVRYFFPRGNCSIKISTDLSPPSSFNDFTNVFDFDFSTSSNEIPSDWQSNLVSSTSPNSAGSSSCSPTPSFSSLDGSDSKSAISRESSPSHEDRQRQRRRFPCLILGCARRFTSQYTLKVHMEAHKPKPRSSFPCTHGCSERFSRQHDRLRHEVSKHGKVCEHSCDECGRFFSSKKTLGNHKCPVAQGNTRWVNSSAA